MKNSFRRRTRKSTLLIILISILIVITTSIWSLDYYDFDMVSEEAAIAYRGFPYPMLISKSVFYGGYVGEAAREGGSEYIREAAGGDDNYRLFGPGLVANIIMYGVAISSIIVFDLKRHYLIGWFIDTLKENGKLLGGVMITTTILLSGILLLPLALLAFYVFAAIMSTFFP